MAIQLSSAQSSRLEPLRQNRWVLQFTAVPGNVSGEGSERLAFAAHTASQPSISFEESEAHRLNERFYYAGKPTWETIEVSFYDYIQGQNSAGHILWEWATSVYNPVTGQMFFKSQYSTSATLAMLDPAGGVTRAWNLFYAWPQTVNWNDLDASSDELVDVALTLRFDYAVKATDINTSPD